jgi:Transposase
MKRSRFTEEQLIGMLRDQEADASVAELRREQGMAQHEMTRLRGRTHGGSGWSPAFPPAKGGERFRPSS